MHPCGSETEFGVPIPGRELPEALWARTAIKRLPPEGPLDWPAIFGRVAPIVLDLGCGNGRFTLLSALARPDHFHFAEHPGPWPNAPEGRSRREILARSRGLRIFRGVGHRRDDIAPREALALAETLPPPDFRSRGPWLELDALEP